MNTEAQGLTNNHLSTLQSDTTPRGQRPERLFTAERRQRILAMLEDEHTVTVEALSSQLRVSRVTIRSDLNYLARNGLAERSRGGAVATTSGLYATPFALRAQTHTSEKIRIARAARRFITEGETVILDAGTTVEQLGRTIMNVRKLTVVTAALGLAARLSAAPGIDVIAVGGRLQVETMSSIGPTTEAQIAEAPAHKAFIGAHGVDADNDIVEVSLEIARLKRATVKAAREVIMLADSSKWTVRGIAKVIDIADVNTVITDSALDSEICRKLEERGIELIIA